MQAQELLDVLERIREEVGNLDVPVTLITKTGVVTAHSTTYGLLSGLRITAVTVLGHDAIVQ